MQTGLGWGMGLEAGPGAEHVESCAKATFADHEGALMSPRRQAPGQVVAVNKNMLGFRATIMAREIDIIELRRNRADRAVFILMPGEVWGCKTRQWR